MITGIRYCTVVLLMAGSLLFGAYGTQATTIHSEPIVVTTLPHDPSAFTQGLLYDNGFLYESTGLYGNSSLRKINAVNGKILKQIAVPGIFAEGLTKMDGLLVQLSWKEQIARTYSANDFMVKKAFAYQGEGWGLTSNGTEYIMSNGSDTLYFRSKSFAVTKKICARFNGVPVQNLNELEYANGNIYANVWYSNNIVEISPKTGAVTRIIDCNALVRKAAPTSTEAVLNGIAYNPKTRTFYITGKNWNTIFVVRW